MTNTCFSEGDYIQTIDGFFFAVKGSRHFDDMVIAILRYIPDPKGERVLEGRNYRRVYDVDATTEYLRENYPHYLNYVDWIDRELQSVLTSHIKKIYNPKVRLAYILKKPKSVLEKKIADFIEALSFCSEVSTSYFGVSGSLLIGAENENSDIDINVYGENVGRRVYDALTILRSSESWISSHDFNSVERVLKSRWGATGLELAQLREVECSKVLHGLVQGVEYFIRLLTDDDQSKSTPIGKARITGRIIDDSKSIYTPCFYTIENAEVEFPIKCMVSELKSYRGKFTEQVKKGDIIEAYGTLERVSGDDDIWYRLILGQISDYLLSIMG
ncbi:hypothetical protein ACFL0D_00795 [Thermoproteota archaeon]